MTKLKRKPISTTNSQRSLTAKISIGETIVEFNVNNPQKSDYQYLGSIVKNVVIRSNEALGLVLPNQSSSSDVNLLEESTTTNKPPKNELKINFTDKEILSLSLKGQTLKLSEYIRCNFITTGSVGEEMVIYRRIYKHIKQQCGNGKENTGILKDKLKKEKPVTYKELIIGAEQSIGALIHHFGIERVWKAVQKIEF